MLKNISKALAIVSILCSAGFSMIPNDEDSFKNVKKLSAAEVSNIVDLVNFSSIENFQFTTELNVVSNIVETKNLTIKYSFFNDLLNNKTENYLKDLNDFCARNNVTITDFIIKDFGSSYKHGTEYVDSISELLKEFIPTCKNLTINEGILGCTNYVNFYRCLDLFIKMVNDGKIENLTGKKVDFLTDLTKYKNEYPNLNITTSDATLTSSAPPSLNFTVTKKATN